MRNRNGLNNLLNRDRKTLYTVLSILLVSVLTLTVVYAALSTTLNINGNAEVTAASWDIHFDNIQINSGSVEATKSPAIIDSKTIDFAIGLKEPGDYYKFTVDIVNEGTIDAMIDSVVKTPELTETQAKYLKYEIEYTDGNSINSKQLLLKDSTKTMSVLVAYRSDVAPGDIPTTGENLNLSFTMVYTQADETGTEIPESTPTVRVVSGDYDTVGSEIAIGDEHFYVISTTTDYVTMFAKYNLYVGGVYNGNVWTAYGEEATGIQDSTMLGYETGKTLHNGTTAFSSVDKKGTNYSDYSGSIVEEYVNNYRVYLTAQGVTPIETRLITKSELEMLGCSGDLCSNAPEWVYSTSYWSGTSDGANNVWDVFSNADFANSSNCNYDSYFGVRPVITISKSEF